MIDRRKALFQQHTSSSDGLLNRSMSPPGTKRRKIFPHVKLALMAGTSALMADNRRPWRRRLQEISGESQEKQEPRCKPFTSLAAITRHVPQSRSCIHAIRLAYQTNGVSWKGAICHPTIGDCPRKTATHSIVGYKQMPSLDRSSGLYSSRWRLPGPGPSHHVMRP
jgi:hypothetical protein